MRQDARHLVIDLAAQVDQRHGSSRVVVADLGRVVWGEPL
jgi:hypothetical protein